jgi:hypothetical protein
MQISEYEKIDRIRHHHLRFAEKHCHKLRKGNVAYSDTIQDARVKVEGWSLLLRHSKGLKVSSWKVSRTIKKAEIPTEARGYNTLAIKDELQIAAKKYYELKKSAKQLRMSYLE